MKKLLIALVALALCVPAMAEAPAAQISLEPAGSFSAYANLRTTAPA